MKLSTLLTRSVLALGFVALVACDDSSSSSDNGGESNSKLDCSVTKGTVVVSPKGGETFKLGDSIEVVFGTDIVDGSYRIIITPDEETPGLDLVSPSLPSSEVEADGKTCNTVKVYLDPETAEAMDEALIEVQPYARPRYPGYSKAFKVVE